MSRISYPPSSGGASPLTTKGDIYSYSTVGARLPVGTDGQILSANSAQALGLQWIDDKRGDVIGSASSNDNAIVRFDGTTGKIIQDYSSNPPTITDTGQVFIGAPPTLSSQGTAFNTNTTDMNSNVIINSFQASGVVNSGGNVQALQFNVLDNGTNNIGTLTGVNGLALKSGSGSVSTITGVQASVRTSGTVTASNIYGFNSQLRVQTGTTVTTATNFNASTATVTGAITAQYGFRASAQKITNVTTGYGFAGDGTSDLNYFLGIAGVGVIPTVNNGYLQLPSSSTAINGGIVWGTDTNIYRSTTNTLKTDSSLLVDGVLTIKAGASSGQIAKIGGVIFDHYTDANNGTTVETDLYSDTIPASLLSTDGQGITAQYHIVLNGAVGATQDVRIYYGGSLIYDTGALSIGVATNNLSLSVFIIRVSSSVARCSVSVNSDFATLFPYSKYTELTGLTFTNTQILKITGQASGAGAMSNQITAKLGSVYYKASA